ncbi:cation:proton antiporter [Dongia deserti]|uniref:cation:proton antiporter n=1 Tax=Dongia deserti TaxID=2268030 RepID=UPI000E651661|nr:sodium:proton antiporter [Dongia deserti]
MTLTPLDAAAALIVLAAFLGYLNHRLLGLPQAIGLTVMGAAASLLVILIDFVVPYFHLVATLTAYLAQIDFHEALIDGMLSFLLFAGALHVDLSELRRNKWAVATLSTIGVLLSTLIVGAGFRLLAALFGVDLPFAWCLVFGALISPTDPVAVMGILKNAKVSKSLESTVAGESLFNDGVGLVVFLILVGAAVTDQPISFAHGAELFIVEAFGGALLGLCVGYLGFIAMRSIDEHNLEVLISLAMVMGGYAIAHHIHVSGPIAMAVAGLLIGNHGMKHAVSERTRDHMQKFWSLLDEILNSALFLLIGLEVVAISTHWSAIAIGLMAIPLVLLARAGSVWPPLAVINIFSARLRGSFPILLWGGLRGGISIALALSLPASPMRDVILTATYIIVVFSVIVQGGTVGSVARRVTRRVEAEA